MAIRLPGPEFSRGQISDIYIYSYAHAYGKYEAKETGPWAATPGPGGPDILSAALRLPPNRALSPDRVTL